MKTRYGLIRHNNPDKFVTDVNAAMKDGWILVGGVAVTEETYTIPTLEGDQKRTVYAQAMLLKGINGIEIKV